MISKESEEEGLKRADEIKLLWSQTGLIENEDMTWLLKYARLYWTLGRIADDSWLRNRTEIFTLYMEINELERQLKEKNND